MVSVEVIDQTRPDKPFAELFPINQKHHMIDVRRKIIVHNCKKKFSCEFPLHFNC